jgi:hypothetical protein
MFDHLKVKELKALIKQCRSHAMIKKYSHMKKDQLIELLESKFTLKDGNLYLKPKLVQAEPTNAEPMQSALEINNQLKRLIEDTDRIERDIITEQLRPKMSKDKKFARRIRG